MAQIEEYANKYQCAPMEREDGILQLTLHTDGGPLQWSMGPHGELPHVFADIGSDPDNKIVIMTGTVDAFSGPQASPAKRLRRSTRQ